jgi:acetoacetyl-CoA synthetase
VKEGAFLWTPSAALAGNSHIARYMAWLTDERGLEFGDYDALWRWSVDDISAFWASVWDYFDVQSDGEWEEVVKGGAAPGCRWFEGVRVNYAEHLLRFEAKAAPGQVAIRHGSEIRPLETMSWQDLGAKVRRMAESLRSLGIAPGDRIVSYMPNVPETVVAMMATVAIGATWSSAAPEFGSQTVVERFAQIEPKLIFAADGYSFGGKRFDRAQEIQSIVAALPTLERIVWLPYLDPNSRFESVVETIPYDRLLQGPPIAREDFAFTRVPFDHPLWVLFSSGTTGLPKAIVHSHAGILAEHLVIMHFHKDLGPGSCFFFYTTTGWMMWMALIAGLLTGSAIVLYDGSPFHPGVDRLWGIAEEAGVTSFGASPSLVQAMEQAGVSPKERYDLGRLDSILLSGAPATPETFAWFYRNVGEDLWVASSSGGTELCGTLVGGVPILPVFAGEIQARALGKDVRCWDGAGRDLVNEVGELVVAKPFPSMPLRFWGDEGDARYRSTYFEAFPGAWHHGDFIKINERGGCYIYGRSDATLNRHGIRIGTSEIYRPLQGLAEVEDSLVVCLADAGSSSRLHLFVRLADGLLLDDGLASRIRQRLREGGSPRHVPDAIHQVPAIPYTLTGKKMEIPVRHILEGAPPEVAASPDAMADPGAMDWFVGFARSLRQA